MTHNSSHAPYSQADRLTAPWPPTQWRVHWELASRSAIEGNLPPGLWRGRAKKGRVKAVASMEGSTNPRIAATPSGVGLRWR